MRIALGIEYDGTQYHGWQQQPALRSVQETLETALSKIANHPVKTVCAGRTDTGVHAFEQIIHFDTEAKREPIAWLFGVNTELPPDMSVQWALPVPNDFHARFSAIARRYRYLIYNCPTRPALWAHRAIWEPRPLNHKYMAKATKFLIGEHDFSSYRALGCQAKQPIRQIMELTVKRRTHFITIDMKANGFLHHMVRNIAGVLIMIGQGKHPPRWAKIVLEAKDRRLGGMTAPACGLYFMQAYYPKLFKLPHRKLPVLY